MGTTNINHYDMGPVGMNAPGEPIAFRLKDGTHICADKGCMDTLTFEEIIGCTVLYEPKDLPQSEYITHCKSCTENLD